MNKEQTKPVKPLDKPAHSAQVSQVDVSVRPTKRQKELLEFIASFIDKHGYSPSYREIMRGLDYNSVATVALHVKNLILRGHLKKRDRSARSLEVVSSDAEKAPIIRTNQLEESEEKWLVKKVEQLIDSAEASEAPTSADLEDIAILLAALRILGALGAVQTLGPRLKQLQTKLNQ